MFAGMKEQDNPVVAFLNRISRLSSEAAADFNAVITRKSYRKNTELLKIGNRATGMFFINTGLARVYYEKNGMEVSDYFAIDGQFIGAVPSLFTGEPSRKAIHLLEDADVFYFSSADFEACCEKHHELERAARRMAYYALAEEQQRIESLRFNSIAERYRELETKYPGITNRCPLKYIATYLGTTQVSISRIRSGIQ